MSGDLQMVPLEYSLGERLAMYAANYPRQEKNFGKESEITASMVQ